RKTLTSTSGSSEGLVIYGGWIQYSKFFSNDQVAKTPRPKSRRIWWTVSGSNRLPPPCKGGALPDELTARNGPILAGKRHLVNRKPSAIGGGFLLIVWPGIPDRAVLL